MPQSITTYLLNKLKLDNLILVLSALLIFSIMGAQVYFSLKQDALHEEVESVELLRKLIIDRETGQRGYIITADTKFLEPYLNAEKDITQLVAIPQHPAFLAHKDELTAELEARRVYFKKTIQFVATAHREDAAKLVATGEGKEHTDYLRNIIQKIFDSYNKALKTNEEIKNLLLLILVTLAIIYLVYSVLRSRFIFKQVLNFVVQPVTHLKSQLTTFTQNQQTAIENEASEFDEINELNQSALQMSSQIIHQNRVIKEKSAAQSKLFAIIGHELRTPASILKHLIDIDDVEKLEHGNTIKETLNHLLDVLDDMRAITQPDFALTSTAKMTNIIARLESAAATVERITADNNLAVVVETPRETIPDCFINAKLISQITLNLIKNCAYYSKGTTLRIIPQLVYETEYEAKISILFSDDGIGISEELKPKLFTAFERGNTTLDGTGLGLNISKKFANEYLNGDLVLLDTLSGATFELTFTAPKSETAAAANISLENMSILYAEDNATIRLTTELLLGAEGAVVTTAEDGEKALAALDTGNFDVILTDIFMPNMNGYEFTEALRKRGYNKPIIGMSAASIGNETQQLIYAGADACLQKPFNVEDFQQTLIQYHSKTEIHQPRQSPNATKSVNWERIDNIFKGDHKTLHPLLEDVCQDVGGVVSSLTLSATIDRETAHRIKGSCMNIGFEKLAEYFSQVEQVVQQQPLPESLINAIQEELVQVRQAVEQRITDSATLH